MDLTHLPPKPGIQPETLSSSVGWYEHTVLDDSVDCIRLISLSHKRVNGQISCTLKPVAFADRPKYEALSYSWGQLPVKETILVDRKKFKVGTNLFNALSHFVDGGRDRILWIDAICIDQMSIEDKNRQLRLMPYIYQRAQKVIVWLDWPEPVRNIADLDHSPYWQRLWIVQEIGKARDLEVHFLEGSQSWVDFINSLPHHTCSCDVCKGGPLLPIKLQKEREESYNGSHTMLNLMRNHQNQLCQDQRDKIYALIGLAQDVADSKYPINYSSSLEQVYLDAIAYRTSDVSRSQHDMVEFSQLARQLLGVFLNDEKEGRTRIESQIPAENTDKTELSNRVRVSAKVLGKIKCLGPTVEVFLSSVSETERWNNMILENSSKPDREIVRKENDLFLARLENFYSHNQNVVESFEDRKPPNFKPPYLAFGSRIATHQESDTAGLKNIRLCLLRHLTASKEEDSFLGLVPPGTRQGSFICQISGIQRAIVLSPSQSSSSEDQFVEYIGSAAVAIPAGLVQTVKRKPGDFQEIFYTPRFGELERREQVHLDVDVEFMHHLSRPSILDSISDISYF